MFSAIVEAGAHNQPLFQQLCTHDESPQLARAPGRLHLLRRQIDSDHNQYSAAFARSAHQLCIVAVPLEFDVLELCKLAKIAHSDIVAGCRLINHQQDSLLLEFISTEAADRCFERCNGFLFDRRRSEVCYVLHLHEVRTISTKLQSPHWLLDSERPALLAELPICPMCLERVDSSVSGLFSADDFTDSIFSSTDRWSWINCQTCDWLRQADRAKAQRLLTDTDLIDRLSEVYAASEHCAAVKCTSCAADDDLWICVICANIGCSRYLGGHAVQHFEQCSHRYSIEISSQMMWDYGSDRFVHRLHARRQCDDEFLYESDDEPKMVPALLCADAMVADQLPSQADTHSAAVASFDSGTAVGSFSLSRSTSGADDGTFDADDAESEHRDLLTAKVESIAAGYNRLLNAQLSEQARYFEQQVELAERRFNDAASNLDDGIRAARQQLVDAKAAAETAERDRAHAERTLSQSLVKQRRVENELEFVKVLNEQMTRSLAAGAAEIDDPELTSKLRLANDLERRVDQIMKKLQEN